MNEEKPLGRIVIDVFKNRESVVEFIGNLDSLNLPNINYVIRTGFFGTYSTRRRNEEIKNLAVNIKLKQEADALEKKQKLEKEEALKLELNKLKDLEKKDKDARNVQILKDNLKLEAERILKKEAKRKAQQSGDVKEIEWAEKQIEASKEIVKEATNGDLKF